MADFFKSIWEWLSKNWITIKDIASVLGNVGMFVVAFYTFRLTVFPKKLKFIGFKNHISAFDGESAEFVLENRAISPVVVRSVDLVVNNKYIAISNEMVIIEGFKTATIKMAPYSEIRSADGVEKLDIGSLGKWKLSVNTSRGVQSVEYERMSKRQVRKFYKRMGKRIPTTVCRNTYNGKIVVPGVKYALSFCNKDGELQTVFIDKSGAMSAAPFGYNSLPKEMLDDENALRAHFEGEFLARKMAFGLERIVDFGVDEGTNEHVMSDEQSCCLEN